MPRPITSRTTLALLRREAKRWLKALRAGDGPARARLQRALPHAPERPTLRDVQHALAREHGLPGWTALKLRLDPDAPLRRYERVAEALAAAYRTGDERAMRVVGGYFGHRRAWEAMRRYVRLDLGKPETPARPEEDDLTLAEARSLVAAAQGLESWRALEELARELPPGPATALRPVALHAAGEAGRREAAARTRVWDEAVALLRERRLPGLHASGQMTDALLDRVSRLGHLTELELEGSGALTDEGLRHLARLPDLRRLDLSGCGGITDRGVEVLRRLPALEWLSLAGTRVTDAGAAHLAACDGLRAVDLSGTATGDGALRALAGKPRLSDLRSGSGVTDAGLGHLHEIPAFRQWQGGEPRMSLLGFDAGPTFLMLRGPVTDRGMARLVGLDGLFALSLDDARLAVTGAGLAPLAELPRLGWLAFGADDASMPYIAALPRLRFLMCQDTVAGDDGFAALGRSRSIEYIWGRRCHNLGRRGFTALADMPALAHLSVSCRNVDDAGLSALPRFPALRELMPMDVPDDGYRHVGRCERLESLVLMYCRDTTDAATEHLAALPGLRKYFASYTRATDRTPEILAGMATLEEVELDSCAGLTSAGIAALARLPRLREVRVSGMPNVTADVASAFPARVRVKHAV